MIKKFSSIEQIIRIRFIRFIQIKINKESYSSLLSVRGIKLVEKIVIKKQQEYEFSIEIKCLRTNKKI